MQSSGVIDVPEFFHLADISVLTHMIADMLGRLTAHNDQIPLTSSNLTRFHSRAPPAISILDYLRRIVRYASVERICLLILLIYIDRVCERNRSFTISSLTVHRFIITGVTVASKAICDSFLQNSMYAKVGGISTKELNILELEFLFLIDWDLTASNDRLQEYYQNLVRQHPNFRRIVSNSPANLALPPHQQSQPPSVQQQPQPQPQPQQQQPALQPPQSLSNSNTLQPNPPQPASQQPQQQHQMMIPTSGPYTVSAAHQQEPIHQYYPPQPQPLSHPATHPAVHPAPPPISQPQNGGGEAQQSHYPNHAPPIVYSSVAQSYDAVQRPLLEAG